MPWPGVRRWPVLALLLFVEGALAKPTADSQSVVIDTVSLGRVQLREYGVRGNRVAIALHGATNSEFIRHEWDNAAAALAQQDNYNVFLPNLHEVSRGKINAEALAESLQEIATWATGSAAPASETPLPLLMGKSWGGALAGEVAVRLGTLVQRLVLVAPAGLSASEAAKIASPTALFYAKDDTVFTSGASLGKALKHEAMFFEAASGGHTVLAEYTPKIVAFASGAGRGAAKSELLRQERGGGGGV